MDLIKLSLSFSLCLSLFLFLSVSLSPSLSVSLFLSVSVRLSLPVSLSFYFSLSLSLPLCLSLSLSLSFSLRLSSCCFWSTFAFVRSLEGDWLRTQSLRRRMRSITCGSGHDTMHRITLEFIALIFELLLALALADVEHVAHALMMATTTTTMMMQLAKALA